MTFDVSTWAISNLFFFSLFKHFSLFHAQLNSDKIHQHRRQKMQIIFDYANQVRWSSWNLLLTWNWQCTFPITIVTESSLLTDHNKCLGSINNTINTLETVSLFNRILSHKLQNSFRLSIHFTDDLRWCHMQPARLINFRTFPSFL